MSNHFIIRPFSFLLNHDCIRISFSHIGTFHIPSSCNQQNFQCHFIVIETFYQYFTSCATRVVKNVCKKMLTYNQKFEGEKIHLLSNDFAHMLQKTLSAPNKYLMLFFDVWYLSYWFNVYIKYLFPSLYPSLCLHTYCYSMKKPQKHNIILFIFHPTAAYLKFLTFFYYLIFFKLGKMEMRTSVQRFASSRSTIYRNTPTKKSHLVMFALKS